MFHVEQSPPHKRPPAPDAAPGCAAPARCGARRPAAGRAGVLLVLVTSILVAPGCAGIRSVRLYFPEASGLAAVRPGLYVDPALAGPQREAFAADVEAGRSRAAEFYGGLVSSPTVVGCASMDCYRRFGGIARKGVFRNGALLLSPEGLTPVIVAHEWSHAELAARVGRLRTWSSVPQWFDEGIAVLSSRDPEYTEEAWRAATDNGTRVPPLSGMETLGGWLRVTGKDGKTKQLSYGTARHEVSAWYACAGPDGFRDLVASVRDGGDFHETYERTRKAGAGAGCSTWNISASGGSRGPTAGPGAGGAARMPVTGGSGADGTAGGPAAGDGAGAGGHR